MLEKFQTNYGNKKTGPYAEVPADFVTKFAHDAIDAGADILVAGSFVFKSKNPIQTIADLKTI